MERNVGLFDVNILKGVCEWPLHYPENCYYECEVNGWASNFSLPIIV